MSDEPPIDPVEAAVDAMDESGAFENGVFHVSRAAIRSCFLVGLEAYFSALGYDQGKGPE
jgi:hypothetical protein